MHLLNPTPRSAKFFSISQPIAPQPTYIHILRISATSIQKIYIMFSITHLIGFKFFYMTLTLQTIKQLHFGSCSTVSTILLTHHKNSKLVQFQAHWLSNTSPQCIVPVTPTNTSKSTCTTFLTSTKRPPLSTTIYEAKYWIKIYMYTHRCIQYLLNITFPGQEITLKIRPAHISRRNIFLEEKNKVALF